MNQLQDLDCKCPVAQHMAKQLTILEPPTHGASQPRSLMVPVTPYDRLPCRGTAPTEVHESLVFPDLLGAYMCLHLHGSLISHNCFHQLDWSTNEQPLGCDRPEESEISRCLANSLRWLSFGLNNGTCCLLVNNALVKGDCSICWWLSCWMVSWWLIIRNLGGKPTIVQGNQHWLIGNNTSGYPFSRETAKLPVGTLSRRLLTMYKPLGCKLGN